jgi:acyl-CoA reductase-like NAD-dependent aldehyde dehydrogenase
MGASGRAACLNRFADAVMAEVGPLGQALSIDTGRSTFAQFEAIKSVELIRMWAERAGPILEELAGAGQSGQVPAVHYQHRLIPYQVVAVISPWNVPLLLAMIDSLAALSAGCSFCSSLRRSRHDSLSPCSAHSTPYPNWLRSCALSRAALKPAWR